YHHRMTRNLDRRRAYDRDRMARLYAEGQTWWQQQTGHRNRVYYDRARSELRRFQRSARSLADNDDPLSPEEEAHYLAHWRESARQRYHHHVRQAELERDYGPCVYGKPVASKGLFTVNARRCVNPAHEGKHGPAVCGRPDM